VRFLVTFFYPPTLIIVPGLPPCKTGNEITGMLKCDGSDTAA